MNGATVTVQVSDLAALADVICDRDYRDRPPSPENIEKAHALIIKLLGSHASSVYAEDDGSEVPS